MVNAEYCSDNTTFYGLFMHFKGDSNELLIVLATLGAGAVVFVCLMIWCYCRSKKSTATEPAVVDTSPIANAESSSSPADIPGAVNGNLPPSYEMAMSLQGTQGAVFAPVPLSQPKGSTCHAGSRLDGGRNHQWRNDRKCFGG